MGGQRSKQAEREAVLRSLDLSGVARQLNVARLKAALAAGEELTALPGDRHVSASRMQQVLRAVVRLSSRHTRVTNRMLRRETGSSKRTVCRGLAELREACLVIQTPVASGARGNEGNAFRPVWPTLIDLAREQGLQGELFDEFDERDFRSDAGGEEGSAATSAATTASNPKHLSATGESHPPVAASETEAASAAETPEPREASADRGKFEVAPPGAINGTPWCHKWHPPVPQMAPPRATSAGVSSLSRGGARASSFSPSGKSENEEEENLSSSSSFHSEACSRRALQARLQAYGVNPSPLFVEAERNGWSYRDVGELLAWCERQTIDGVQAFGAGIVFRHIERFPPGTTPTVKPRDEYVRAKRERDLRIAAARRELEDANAREEREIDAAKVAAWEARLEKHRAAKGAADDAD